MRLTQGYSVVLKKRYGNGVPKPNKKADRTKHFE